MEIKVNNTKFIEKWLESKIRKARELVESEIETIPKKAQNNYDKFIIEVPADDPYVDVYSDFQKGKDKSTLTINARGTQVLFIEFGAGIYHYTDRETRLYGDIIKKDRPSTIKGIGEYGQGRGKDDIWFYKSKTGRTSENNHLVKYNRNGDPIMITHGNRPSRSLYRAVGITIRRLHLKFFGKAKRIG